MVGLSGWSTFSGVFIQLVISEIMRLARDIVDARADVRRRYPFPTTGLSDATTRAWPRSLLAFPTDEIGTPDAN